MSDITQIFSSIDRIIAQAEQLLRDTASWNDAHPHDTPFDVGGDLCVLALARDVRAALLDGDVQRAARLNTELVRVSTASFKAMEQI